MSSGDTAAGLPEEDDAPRSLQRVCDAGLACGQGALCDLGQLAGLAVQSVRWGFRKPFRGREILKAMEFIGVDSVFIVGLTGFFVGMVFGLQLVDGFSKFGVENQTGAVIGIALARELSPVFAALMVSSRAGSAVTTEIGSMRVSHQIDALTALSVNPVQYLIWPRLVAGTVMVPALAILFNFVGALGAWVVCVELLNLDPGIFLQKIRQFTDIADVNQGVIKASVFGFAVCLIACKQGFFASGGAAGVGSATQRSVVQSAVAVLVLDYLITDLLL